MHNYSNKGGGGKNWSGRPKEQVHLVEKRLKLKTRNRHKICSQVAQDTLGAFVTAYGEILDLAEIRKNNEEMHNKFHAAIWDAAYSIAQLSDTSLHKMSNVFDYLKRVESSRSNLCNIYNQLRPNDNPEQWWIKTRDFLMQHIEKNKMLHWQNPNDFSPDIN